MANTGKKKDRPLRLGKVRPSPKAKGRVPKKKVGRAPTGFERVRAELKDRFVTEYLVDHNSTEALIRAGWRGDRVRAGHYGRMLLSDEGVLKVVLETMERTLCSSTDVTVDNVLRELSLIAFSDVTDYKVNDAGELVLNDEVQAHKTRAVQSVKFKKYYDNKGTLLSTESTIKLWSKTSAIDMLNRYLALYRDLRVNVSNTQINVNAGGTLTPQRADEIKRRVLFGEDPEEPAALVDAPEKLEVKGG